MPALEGSSLESDLLLNWPVFWWEIEISGCRRRGRLGPVRQGAEVVIEVVDGVGLEAKLRDALGRVARNDQCHVNPAL